MYLQKQQFGKFLPVKENQQMYRRNKVKSIIILMQQFVKLINERLERIKEAQTGDLNFKNTKYFKQEERKRCLKQNLVLSMIKSQNKMLTSSVKKNYLETSLIIMRKLLPQFHYVHSANGNDQFLNDMVCLYHSFFKAFEIKWNFKIPIEKLLRPTNFNIIHDLIKYLSYFTRDYYQHLHYWKFKELSEDIYQKIQCNNKEQQEQKPLESQYQDQSTKSRNLMRISSNSFKIKLVRQRESSLSNYRLKKHSQHHYDILDIFCLPSFAGLNKKSISLQNLTYKISQIFKQCKFRNSWNRQNYNNYMQLQFMANKSTNQTQFQRKKEYQQYISRQYKSKQDKTLNMISYPFQIELKIDKNGYSQLLVNYKTKKKQKYQFLNKKEGHQVEKLQIQNLRKQCLLNSLRVLRMTDRGFPKMENVKIQDEHDLWKKKDNKDIDQYPNIKSIKTLSLFNQCSFAKKKRYENVVKEDNDEKIIKWLGKMKNAKMVETIRSLTLKRLSRFQ